MKFIGCLAVLALLVNLSTQTSKFQNCSPEFQKTYPNPCSWVTCDDTGDSTAVECRRPRCKSGKIVGYTKRDDSKVFPNCCRKAKCGN